MTKMASKGNIMYILISHLNLMVPKSQVNFGEIHNTMNLINELIYPKDRVPIFIIPLFRTLKLMHILKGPSFFLTNTTNEEKGLELGWI